MQSLAATERNVADDFGATVEKHHRALDTFVTGDAGPLHALYSRREDVTIANPFGPPQCGWAAVEDTTARAAAHYADGRALGFDEVSKYVTPELAYTVELEHYEVKVGGSDNVSPVSLRVTTVFRREDDSWKVVHRHADPITAARPAESVIQD
jgi:ketosteroid isomerase-like protein